jgi:hypothetical protein
MKAVLAIALLLGVVAAQADDQVVERSEATGNEQVVSIGSCSIPMVNPGDTSVSSDFPYSVCVETKHYQAKVIRHEQNIWSKTSYEPIPGTEHMTYALATRTNGDTRDIGQSAAIAVAQAMATCGNLRGTLSRSQVPVSETGCGR